MTGMFGVILFTLLPIYLNAKITPPTLNNVTYIQQGSDIILKWKFTFALGTLATRTWRFIKTGETIPTTLAIIVADGAPTTFDKVFKGISVTKPATLILKDASVAHSGTYRFEIAFNAGASPPPSDIMVIIPVRPTAKVTCSGEGDAASCLCEGIDGIPAADTTWLKGKKTIKGPEDLSTTMVKKDIIPNGEGVYTCKANSANLTDEASVTLSKPKNISFKSEMDGDRIKLVCKVVGTPAPVYLISLNGSVAKEDKNGVKYIGKESVGQYECLAKNVLGNVTKYLFFNGTVSTTHATTPSVQISTNERVPVKHTTPPSVQMTTKEREKLISDKGTEWYLFLITFICGMIVGMVLLYAIMWLRLRLSKKRDHSKPSQPGAVAGPSGEGLENASAYQELDLQNMNNGDDNYQSLRMTSRNAQSNTAPVEIESEAGYQELNEVRGNADDNYQPLNLNRV